jgi:hypothetical protein
MLMLLSRFAAAEAVGDYDELKCREIFSKPKNELYRDTLKKHIESMDGAASYFFSKDLHLSNMFPSASHGVVRLGSSTIVYNDNIFITPYFIGLIYIRGQRAESYKPVRHPWIEWDKKSNAFVFHETGADEKLAHDLGEVKIYRSADPVEFEVWHILKDLLNPSIEINNRKELSQKLKQDVSFFLIRDIQNEDPVRLEKSLRTLEAGGSTLDLEECAGFVLSLIGKSRDYIAVFAGYTFGGHSSSTTHLRKNIEFQIDFKNLPEELRKEVFIGFELHNIEIGFVTEKARLFLLRHLM